MKIFLFFILCALSFDVVISQNSSCVLTFTAGYKGTYVPLDSIKIINPLQNCDTMLYWPDTALAMTLTGTPVWNHDPKGFTVYQNYPNPITNATTIRMNIPAYDKVVIQLSDLSGRVIMQQERILDAGIHSFTFIPGAHKVYIIKITWRDANDRIKMINVANNSAQFEELKYLGFINTSSNLKNTSDQGFSYNPGDTLYYIGYAPTIALVNGSDALSGTIENADTVQFDILEGLPCDGIPFIEYGGQLYNTVQIGSQCWFKESLNIGTMILGTQDPDNNGVVEKYCFDDSDENCTIFGGLYLWNEMMGYTTQQGTQGICPSGWHLPTETEMTGLINFLGGENIAAGKMKATGTFQQGTGYWYTPNSGATNESGFTSLPAGLLLGGWASLFSAILWDNYLWTSTECNANSARAQDLMNLYAFTSWWSSDKDTGQSVRCLKN